MTNYVSRHCQMSPEEFEQIQAYLHNIQKDSKSEILLQWYKPDYNAVPLSRQKIATKLASHKIQLFC